MTLMTTGNRLTISADEGWVKVKPKAPMPSIEEHRTTTPHALVENVMKTKTELTI